ncbi:hypothetical protein EJ05DRAFT_480899 [Pseudovirgaria hyperparasitica]|uniref:RING-CH-type domain-containing protein n=1 Tax=Pseudovirgaria hyperparasitica TaxID=470096 RepID=A0A6A6VQJ8_9PEZI|nr:uncharacterized protein EJ05DRAFT_480899 [Pseudovirgaria hyperparasitica]KAF2752882.1 hypothetical protein EJ05DRAFT_480899 [Pseudovirgaria hyperparasitica]
MDSPEHAHSTGYAHVDPTDWHTFTQRAANPQTDHSESTRPNEQHPPQEHFYRPRTCRICFDIVQPTLRPPMESLPGFLQPRPEVVYEDEAGRLIRPCKCKGSSKYVHDGCLAQWRMRDPTSRRNFYECPTCGFKYKLSRLGWAGLLANPILRVVLSITVLTSIAFILGFFAETIIRIGLDPMTIVTDQLFEDSRNRHHQRPANEPVSWYEHFANGFVSIGVVGFLKVLLSNPWNWINGLRGVPTGGRQGRTGRERITGITWIAIMIGVITVLYGIWKAVQAWSKRILRRVEQKVMDVHDADDGDDEDD